MTDGTPAPLSIEDSYANLTTKRILTIPLSGLFKWLISGTFLTECIIPFIIKKQIWPLSILYASIYKTVIDITLCAPRNQASCVWLLFLLLLKTSELLRTCFKCLFLYIWNILEQMPIECLFNITKKYYIYKY